MAIRYRQRRAAGGSALQGTASSRVVWAGMLLASLWMLCLIAPSSASAHAVLTSTTPANESQVKRGPDRIAMQFNESVSAAFGGVKVFGPDGARVDTGSVRSDGRAVEVPVRAKSPGTYAVSWRAVSADGHPIRGAFVFHVARRSGDTVSRDKARTASQVSRFEQVAFGVARFVAFAGLLVGAGGLLFSMVIAPGWRPRVSAIALVLAAAGSAASFVLDASIAGGFTVPETLRWSVLVEQAHLTFGLGALVRTVLALALAGVAALAVRRRPIERRLIRWVIAGACVCAIASFAISGHARTADNALLRVLADMLHVTAAGVWIGGLVQLAFGAGVGRPEAVRRFSTAALVSIVVIIGTGLIAAWGEIGLSAEAALDTVYGRLVIGKMLLVAAVLPLGWLNRRNNVPAKGKPGNELGLARYVRGELALVVVIIGLTSWLVVTPPAKSMIAPKLVEKTVGLRDGSLQVIVDPAAAGSNNIHLYVFTESNQPDDEVTSLALTAEESRADLGPFEITLHRAGPGHFTVAEATIPQPGKWQFIAQVTRTKFDRERARFVVEIAPRTGSGKDTT